MRKKILTLVLVLLVVFSFSSCDSAESGVVVTQPVLVAVQTDSAEYFAAHDFSVGNGYDLVEYETRQAAVVAVENGKADYVVVNSDEVSADFLSSVDLQWCENTDYSIDYCAVFRNDSSNLQTAFNKAISKLRTDGTFEEINKAYLSGEKYISDNIPQCDDTITILCCPVFDNLLFLDDNGNLVGKELDFISEMCDALSLEAELVIIKEYDEMFTALQEGKGDVIISAVEYTPELENDYLLSDVYNQTTFGVYKRK